ncbi:uncharacterized protein LOC132618052 [Lycium barbarum]|uniref:uncharacterized protein LOC132618052 n=1 Tax=Lycium barbarum TaxID=112863 RepID=UPI00293EE54E|nr:uncharacterized protein LOC132618052 [Lycium barbarum]
MDKIGFWNTRGLNRSNKQREMQLFMRKAKVGLFGLLETKIKRAKTQQAYLNLCNGWEFTTNLSAHPGGRIWLFWQPQIFEMDIEMVTKQLIHSKVTHKGTGRTMIITMVYGFNDQAMRRSLWDAIQQINDRITGPWGIMGDFNCILKQEERLGSPVTLAEIREFTECVDRCGLQDLKSSVSYYTWSNKQKGDDRVYSKIDRVLVNTDWITLLPTSRVHFLNEGLFDHCPAIISWEDGNKGVVRQFKYFNMWSSAPDFKEKVERSWNEHSMGRKMFRVRGKMQRLKKVLLQLNKARFSDIEVQAEKAMTRLTKCQHQIQLNPQNKQLIDKEVQLANECLKVQRARDQVLQQKCKVAWLKEGDQNTKFYHSFLKARRNTNRIFTIKNKEGVYITEVEDISRAFTEYYTELLGTANENRQHADSAMIRTGPILNVDQRSMLAAPFNDQDVKAALWAIGNDKAPSPDGYGSKFFKDSWDIVGRDVTAGVMEFFEHGQMI